MVNMSLVTQKFDLPFCYLPFFCCFVRFEQMSWEEGQRERELESQADSTASTEPDAGLDHMRSCDLDHLRS